MESSVIQTIVAGIGGAGIGFALAWVIRSLHAKRHIARLTQESMTKLDEVLAQRDQLDEQFTRAAEAARQLEARLEQQKSLADKRAADLGLVARKAKMLTENVRTLRTERENTKIKLNTIQETLTSVRRQSQALQSEFEKTREFYKRELTKSFDKRKALKQELKDARAEQEAFAKQIENSVLEHGSEENMVVAAQLRLGQIEVLERNVNKLESENTQLRHDALDLQRRLDQQKRDLREVEQLRLHNRQLVQCVESLENSRKEYEADAERYREKADQSVQESDTLRMKLEDLQKNFTDIEEEQNSALEDARSATILPMHRNRS